MSQGTLVSSHHRMGGTVGVPPRRRSSPRPALNITYSGILCLATTVVVGLAALNSDANLLLLLFGISMGFTVLNLVAPTRMIRLVEVDRIMPGSVIADRPFTVVYVVRSRRRWLGAWSLAVGETPVDRSTRFPHAYLPWLAAGQEQRLELTGRCPRRGRIPLKGIRVTSRFPFGLFSCSVDLPVPGELIVYPAIGRLRHDIWQPHGYWGQEAPRKMHRRGAPDEFYGVREYRPGDSLRWVHWRRSARTGKLVVREHVPLQAAQLIVLVDPWPAPPPDSRPARPKPNPAAERIISAAATIVCDSLERGHRVGLIARSTIPVVIAPAGGRPQRQRLLHELALLCPGTGPDLDVLVSRVRWTTGWHARCLLCISQLGPAHTRVLRFLDTRAEGVTVLAPGTEALDRLFDSSPQAHRERRAG